MVSLVQGRGQWWLYLTCSRGGGLSRLSRKGLAIFIYFLTPISSGAGAAVCSVTVMIAWNTLFRAALSKVTRVPEWRLRRQPKI